MISELTIDILVYLRAVSKYDDAAKELFERLMEAIKDVK